MLPGAPDKAQVLLRNGAWADPDFAETGRGQWAPLAFRTEGEARLMISRMHRNGGYLPDRFRWRGENPP